MKFRLALTLGSLAAGIALYFVIAVHLGRCGGATRCLEFLTYPGIRFGNEFFDIFFGNRCFGGPSLEVILFDIFIVLTSGLQ